MNNTDIKIGMRVRCYGISGGPLPGRVISKDESKHCWVIHIKHQHGYRRVEVHADYLSKREKK